MAVMWIPKIFYFSIFMEFLVIFQLLSTSFNWPRVSAFLQPAAHFEAQIQRLLGWCTFGWTRPTPVPPPSSTRVSPESRPDALDWRRSAQVSVQSSPPPWIGLWMPDRQQNDEFHSLLTNTPPPRPRWTSWCHVHPRRCFCRDLVSLIKRNL